MKTSHRGALIAGLFLLFASPLVMIWSWETDRVDQCTTRGGTFDYDAMSCDLAHAEHPFASFFERHPRFVTVTVGGGLVVLAGALALTRPRAR